MILLKTFIVLTVLTVAAYSLLLACLHGSAKQIGWKPIYALVICYAAAAFLPSLYLVYLCLFVVNALLARCRNDVLAIFLLCFVMMPELNAPLTVGSAYLFDLSAQTSLSLGALASLALRGGAERGAAGKSHFFFMTIITCMIVIMMRGATLTACIRGTAIILVDFGIPYLVFFAGARKPESQSSILVTLSLAGAMLATIGIFEYITSWPTFVVINGHLGLRPSLLVAKFRAGHLRSAGPMGESTEMAFILVFCLLATIASRRNFKGVAEYTLVCGLISIGLLAPQSKGGWVGAGIGIIAVAAYRSTFARPGKFIAASTLSAVFLSVVWVFHAGNDPSNGSSAYRARLFKRGMEEFWQRPIFGDTLSSVMKRLQDLKQGEHIVDFVNSYLYFALMLGAIGLIAVLSGFMVPIARSWMLRSVKNEEGSTIDYASFCFSCFISAGVMFAFTSFIHRAVVLLMMFSLALTRRRRRFNNRTQRKKRFPSSPAVLEV